MNLRKLIEIVQNEEIIDSNSISNEVLDLEILLTTSDNPRDAGKHQIITESDVFVVYQCAIYIKKGE